MADCCQVIDGEGMFQEHQLTRFVQDKGVLNARTNYQVVAIMGPQSSGKSTLMNHVFGTSFTEMDAMVGRQQTTKGVWLAKSPKVAEHCTLVMDLEGSDGRERGEDDTNFERQSALFALAVSDVLLINVWCHDIGREQGSGKPLMKTIFQVNLKLFAPEPNRRRTVLLFVIRDKSKTPLDKLVEVLSDDIYKMWDTISKPPQYVDSKIDDFFEVQYTALPHYEDKYEDFVADTVVLRRRFTTEGEASLVRVAPDKLPADSLVLSTQNIWGIIKSQKDLNLPAHKVMVANIRCSEIKQDQLRSFTSDQAWQALAQASNSQLIRDFGTRVAALLRSCSKGYEMEAMYFDANVRIEHHAELHTKLVALVSGPFNAQLSLLAKQQLAAFDKDFKLTLIEQPSLGFSAAAEQAAGLALGGFDLGVQELLIPGTDLTADEARSQLSALVAQHIEKAKQARIGEAVQATEVTLNKLIAVPVVELLATFPHNLWQQLHAARKQALSSCLSSLTESLTGVRLDEKEQARLVAQLSTAADKRLADLLQEAALTRVSKMRDVFNHHFNLDESGTPRTWRPKDNIGVLAKQARHKAARVLALLAIVRPEDYAGDDAVQAAIMAMAGKDIEEASGNSSSRPDGSQQEVINSSNTSTGDSRSSHAGFELATATQWPGVPTKDVLIAPHEARLAWREFMSASALSVQQAQVLQQANLMAGKRSAPLWALGAILFLGWNEFMVVLWNPLYLLLGAVLFFFGWQMYSELDVDAELQRGPVMGLVNIYNKLGGVLRTVLGHNVEVAQHLGGAVVDMVQQQQQQHTKQGQGFGSAAGDGTTVLHSQQQRQQHQSAGVRHRAGVDAGQAGVQMTSLQQAAADTAAGQEDDKHA